MSGGLRQPSGKHLKAAGALGFQLIQNPEGSMDVEGVRFGGAP